MKEPTTATPPRAPGTTPELAPRGDAFPSWLALIIALAALVSGLQLMAMGGHDPVGAGILLLVVALAFTAVALAQGAYGPDAEGPLDLSARLGLGLLGGILGAVAVRVASWITVQAGLLALLGVRVAGWEEAALLGLRGGTALFWGAAFGVLYPYVPGRTAAAKGLVAGTLGALYLLFKTLPLDLGAGWLGVGVGSFAFVAVLLFGVLWGLICAATLSWGSRGDQVPTSRYLGEPAA
jgi:hypothetical protein